MCLPERVILNYNEPLFLSDLPVDGFNDDGLGL